MGCVMSHRVSPISDASRRNGSIPVQGGRIAAPLHRLWCALRRSAWPAAIIRTGSVGGAMIGLAAIGSVSLGRVPTAGTTPVETQVASLAIASATSLFPIPSLSTSAPQHNAPARAAQPGNKAPTLALTTSEPEAPSKQEPGDQPGLTPDGKVILNTANAAQLDRLPGVGPKRAEQILELRTRLGRFRSLNDLLRIRGIGSRTLKKMLPHLVLDPPDEATP